ncbi:MAG: UDP-galactofuranosyl transferase GlfT1, catalyzes initiation of cell wall galactan polymerization, partial [uncultured Blastococcus sp.]
ERCGRTRRGRPGDRGGRHPPAAGPARREPGGAGPADPSGALRRRGRQRGRRRDGRRGRRGRCAVHLPAVAPQPRGCRRLRPGHPRRARPGGGVGLVRRRRRPPGRRDGAGHAAGLRAHPRPGRGLADGRRQGRPRAAGLPAAPRAALAPPARRLRGHGAAARLRLAVQRRALPCRRPRRGRSAGLPAVPAGRRDRGAPPAGAFRPALRHLPARGLPAPRGHRGVPADPRRAAVGAVPLRRGQEVLHLPQPGLPHGPARHALAVPARTGAVLLVLPRPPRRLGPADLVRAGAAGPPGAVHPPL